MLLKSPTMQEMECFRGGACSAISLEGLEWLYKRKCNDGQIKKRDRNQRGRNQQAFTLPPFINSTCERCPWTDLPHAPDNINYLTKAFNCNSKERVVILYNDHFYTKLISDAIYCQEDLNISRNENNYDKSDVNNKDYSDSCICDGEMMKESGIRKSVSFADDVIVYLYDKDSPADKLNPESDDTTSSSSHLLSQDLPDNNGLEWEDDFSALERNCHPHSHPESGPASTQTWSQPRSVFLPQSCLFLTHVNESDLEP